jgi:hypothetical protein
MEKITQKFKNLPLSVQIVNIKAFLTDLLNAYEKKITFDNLQCYDSTWNVIKNVLFWLIFWMGILNTQ